MKIQYIIVIFAILFLITVCGCEKEDTSCIAVLPNLVILPQSTVNPGIGSTAKLLLTTIVENKDTIDGFCVADAPASESVTVCLYRSDPSGPWQQVQFSQNGNLTYDVIVPRPILKVRQQDIKKEDYNLTTAGYYQFRCSVDKNNKIKESNENDNSKTSKDAQLNKIRNQNDNGFYVSGAPYKKGQSVVVFVHK